MLCLVGVPSAPSTQALVNRCGTRQNRQWQARNAWRRVVRGGSFDNSPENLRSANRDNDHPEDRDRNNGFRCVRVPPQHAVVDNAMQRLSGLCAPSPARPFQ